MDRECETLPLTAAHILVIDDEPALGAWTLLRERFFETQRDNYSAELDGDSYSNFRDLFAAMLSSVLSSFSSLHHFREFAILPPPEN